MQIAPTASLRINGRQLENSIANSLRNYLFISFTPLPGPPGHGNMDLLL